MKQLTMTLNIPENKEDQHTLLYLLREAQGRIGHLALTNYREQQNIIDALERALPENRPPEYQATIDRRKKELTDWRTALVEADRYLNVAVTAVSEAFMENTETKS